MQKITPLYGGRHKRCAAATGRMKYNTEGRSAWERPSVDLGRKERLCQVQLADGRQAATLWTSSCTARVQASQSQAAKAALGTSALASPTAR